MQRPDINKLKELHKKHPISDGQNIYEWFVLVNPEMIAQCLLELPNLIEYIEELEQTIKEARAEFVKELEGMSIPDVPGNDMEAWRACNKRWRKQRDTLINKYKEV